MCTPADDNILIVGTNVGSLNLYDMTDIEATTYRYDELNYNGLFKLLHPNSYSEDGETNFAEKLNAIKNRYSIQLSTFSTDGLPNYFHYSPIRKL